MEVLNFLALVKHAVNKTYFHIAYSTMQNTIYFPHTYSSLRSEQFIRSSGTSMLPVETWFRKVEKILQDFITWAWMTFVLRVTNYFEILITTSCKVFVSYITRPIIVEKQTSAQKITMQPTQNTCTDFVHQNLKCNCLLTIRKRKVSGMTCHRHLVTLSEGGLHWEATETAF